MLKDSNQIIVMSRPKAEEYFHKPHSGRSILISITNCGDPEARISRNPNSRLFDICRLQFDDVGRGEPNCITKQDAEKIADFVMKYKDANIDTLVIHCEAGISRSRGVAAAISKGLFNDDSLYTTNLNSTCYFETLNALEEKKISLEDIIEYADDTKRELDAVSAEFCFGNEIFSQLR